MTETEQPRPAEAADEDHIDPHAEPNPDEPIEGVADLPDEVRDGDLSTEEPDEGSGGSGEGDQ